MGRDGREEEGEEEGGEEEREKRGRAGDLTGLDD